VTEDTTRIEAKIDTLTECVSALREGLGAMRATVEAHTRQQAERTAKRDRSEELLQERLRTLEGHGTGSHEGRITALERWRWLLTGAAAVAGGGVGAAVSKFSGQ
jgi:hypothetical protein